jgi:hypothetical protein
MLQGKSTPKEISVSARITRSDGTVEDLGVIASTRNGSVTAFLRTVGKKLGVI